MQPRDPEILIGERVDEGSRVLRMDDRHHHLHRAATIPRASRRALMVNADWSFLAMRWAARQIDHSLTLRHAASVARPGGQEADRPGAGCPRPPPPRDGRRRPRRTGPV